MLCSLHIRNYVLIDSLDITFPEGLVIITGQTGAGKSILLGALSLLTGAKADASSISEGAESCVVEAEFEVEDDLSSVREILEENDVESDSSRILIRRVVYSTGRSRSFVNDCPVQVSVLSALSSHLVDIHSQHQSLLLTNHAYQLRILDHFCGNSQLLADCRDAWTSLQSGRAELREVRERLGRLAAEMEYNTAQFNELDQARLQPGELEALEEEQKQLANAEEIKGSLAQVQACFDPSPESVPSLSIALKEAQKLLERTSKFVPSLSELASRLESSRIELDDILACVEDADASVNLSEDRLQIVEDRMSLLYGLMKKHGCSDIDELIAVRERYNEALFDSSSLEDRAAVLEKSVAASEAAYKALCAKLNKARLAGKDSFAASIEESVRFLELDRAVFAVDILPAQEGPAGSDSVLFRFSSTGKDPVDVAKCASGGEISRIMLCLKAMMARYVGMPTMIFDEIDTGVSGSAADKMGTMICQMGRDMQVFSITHLPQVAAKGDAHYVVTKTFEEDGRVVSGIRPVTGEERVMEIARLLSGSSVTEAAIGNARSLLG